MCGEQPRAISICCTSRRGWIDGASRRLLGGTNGETRSLRLRRSRAAGARLIGCDRLLEVGGGTVWRRDEMRTGASTVEQPQLQDAAGSGQRDEQDAADRRQQ